MRLPHFFVFCVLLIAACDTALALRRQFQLRVLPPPLAQTHPADAFASQIDAVTDPTELRRLALARHRSLLAADQTTQDLLATVRSLSRSDAVQSAMIVLLALGIYFSSRHSLRR